MSDASLLTSAGAFAVSYAIVVAAPGPNLLLVAQTGLSRSRVAAIWVAAGIAAGAATLALVIGTGFTWLQGQPILRLGLGLLFLVLLLVAGFRLLASAVREAPPVRARDKQSGISFLFGFSTALTNPVTAAFFFFAQNDLARLDVTLSTAAIVFVTAGLWFGTIALGMSSVTAQSTYWRWRRVVSTVAALTMIYIALRAGASLLVYV